MSSFRMADILAAVEEEAKKQGVDPAIARAIIIAENTSDGAFRPEQLVSLRTVSPAGASGVGQTMPATVQGLIKQGYIPRDINLASLPGQIKASVAAIREKMQYAGTDPTALAVRYNASMETFKRWKDSGGDLSVLPAETQKYVQKVARNMGDGTTPLSTTGSSDSFAVRSTQKLFPPGMIEGIQGQMENLKTRGGEILGLIQSVTGEYSKDADAAITANEAAGAASARSIKAKADKEVAKTEQQNSMLTMFGIDQTQLQGVMQEVAVAQQEIRNQGAELQALRSVSFMDDPLTWVVNQFKIQGKSDSYNAAVQRFNAGTQMVGDLTARAAGVMQITPSTNEALIQEEAAAEAEKELQLARLRNFEIKGRERSAVLSALSTELAMGNQQVSNSLAMARLAAETASFNFGMEEREQQRTKQTAEDRRIGQELEHVNKWRALMGQQLMTADEWRSTGAAERTAILSKAKSNQLTIAATPGESILAITKYNSWESFIDTHPNKEVRREFLNSVVVKARDAVDAQLRVNPSMVGKKEELIQQEIDKMFQAWNKDPALANRQFNKLPSDHPLRIRPIIAAGAPSLKDNSVAQFVQAAGQKAEAMRDSDIFAYGISQVAAGKPAAAVAKELEQFFRQGAAWQYDSYGLAVLGANVKGPKGYAEYPMSAADMFGMFESFKNPLRQNTYGGAIQAFSATDLERALVLAAAKSKTELPLRNTLLQGVLSNPTAPLVGLGTAAMRNTNIPNPLQGVSIPATGTPTTPPEGQPSIYASPAEWEAYRQRQAGSK